VGGLAGGAWLASSKLISSFVCINAPISGGGDLMHELYVKEWTLGNYLRCFGEAFVTAVWWSPSSDHLYPILTFADLIQREHEITENKQSCPLRKEVAIVLRTGAFLCSITDRASLSCRVRGLVIIASVWLRLSAALTASVTLACSLRS
jgi:hypothetical protein